MPFLKSLLYCVVVGFASNLIGEALRRRWFHADRFPFRCAKWERQGKIYEKIQVQSWKDRMPDMSRIMKNMVPKKLEMFPTSAEVYTLIDETCVAEAVHTVLCLLSVVIYFFWKNYFGVVLIVIYIMGNLPFIIIQRYNRPALLALAQRLEAREQRKKEDGPQPEVCR